jgi:Zn finger protein HypA/HybF involved in hydrogenase expression
MNRDDFIGFSSNQLEMYCPECDETRIIYGDMIEGGFFPDNEEDLICPDCGGEMRNLNEK